MPRLALAEVDIEYVDQGDGFPLVLIPGFASGAWSWEWQAGELSKDFRVITVDPRGVSNSVLKEGVEVSISVIADDVAEILDARKIDAANVLGISFGGFVAQEFALRYPKRLNKLVLSSTSFGGPNHVAPSMEVLGSFASTEGLNSADRIRKYLTLAFAPEFVETKPDVVDRFCSLREENLVPEEVYRQQLQSAMEFDTEGRVSQISAETLVLSGDQDSVVPVENSLNLADKLPNARLEIMPDAGHMAFVERSGEFNRIVKAFLIS